MAKDNEKSVNLEVDRELWRDVGVYSASNGVTKKEVVGMALKQFLSKGEKVKS